MSVAVKNLGEFDAAVTGWLANVKQAAEAAATGLAKEAFENLLRNSPQYSGDFVAGWGVGYGQVVTNFKADRYHEQKHPDADKNDTMFQRGDEPAMNDARQAAVWKRAKLGTPIYISNDAHHDENYAWKVENGEINFRTPNMGSEKLVKRGVAYVARRYTNISKNQLDTWRKLGT